VSEPLLSVVIPAWRAVDHLGACLDALARQSAAGETFEVIVVDDASPDATAALAEEHGVRVVRRPENGGAAAARNSGAQAALGTVLVFVDSDVVPDADLVAGCLALFDLLGDGTDGPSVATGRYSPEPANDTSFARYKALWTWFCWEQTAAKTGTSGHIQGALSAIRRDLFLELGGFDESYEGGSVEDYELSLRLRERGERIVFDDRLQGRHRFPGFQTVARNYWDRARMWSKLGAQRQGFSSGQANPRSAAAAVCALGSLVGHVALPVLPFTLPVVLAADVGYLVAVGPFLVFVARREGVPFAVYAGAVHYALSAVVGAAAVTAPFGRGSRTPVPG
jgi:hypothetical protein